MTLFITPCFHLLRIFAIKKIFMSPYKLVDENDPSTWVAKTKVAPVKFTKRFLFLLLCQRRIRFLIESLAALCVCGRPVHIPDVRKQQNRLLVSSVCWCHICAILKRDNSIMHAERTMGHFEMPVCLHHQKIRE